MNNLEKNEKLMEILHHCASVCYDCANACLNESDVAMLTNCIKLDLDCAEICQHTASFLAKGSEFADQLLRVCVDICTACANECAKHDHMDHCRKCAETCRECAEMCGQIA